MEGDPVTEEDKPSVGPDEVVSSASGTAGTSTEGGKEGDLRVKRATIIVACMALVVLLVAAIALLVVFTKPAGDGDGEERKTVSSVSPRGPSTTPETSTETPTGTSTATPTGFCHWPRRPVDPGKCYQKVDSFGYKVASGKVDDAAQSSELRLNFAAEDGVPTFADIIENITLRVSKLNDRILRIKIFDANHERYEVPVQDVFPLLQTAPAATQPVYDVHVGTTAKGYFAFAVKRKGTDIAVLDTSIGNMLLADQLLQFVTLLPTKNVYGFGENPHASYRHTFDGTIWPLFARDEFPGDGNRNLYGVHPFWMGLEKDGKAHGVLFLNSDAMEYSFLPYQALQLVTIGGILDFFVMLGDGPNHVVELYTDLIGKPFMPPYWALGFQLSRYGYNSTANLDTVLARNKKAGIPQDVQHIDIDYMDERIDFTVNPVAFAGLQATLSRYTQDGLRVVTILDPAIIANRTGYLTYERGLHKGAYINWPKEIPDDERGHPFHDEATKDIMYGQVWPPGPVAFPDFLKSSTASWWLEEIAIFVGNLTFDAIWIDMNEPAEFSTNTYIPTLCNSKKDTDGECWRLRCPTNKYDDPPYKTLAATAYGADNRLSDKTICMAGIQGDQKSYRHYDVHSLYGWSQAVATHSVLSDIFTERSFVLSRSTYVSSGRYAGHWLGDNNSRWVDLHRSIIGMLEFNIFGIPYVGADICGFFGRPTVEMCTRWMQLGAFYPFSRNHNFLEDPDQDPGSFEEEVQNIMRDALKLRYTLLPFLYTLFYHAHVEGTPVLRALWNEFPQDESTHGIDRQFMWGSSLLISPILEEDQKVLTFYLPPGHWYDFYTGERLVSKGENFTKDGLVLATPTPLHLREGTVTPMQKDAINTKQMANSPFSLVICVDESGNAEGDLYWDDGVIKDPVNEGKYLYYTFRVGSNKLTVSPEHGSAASPAPKLKTLILMQSTPPRSVTISGHPQVQYRIKPDGAHKFSIELEAELALGKDTSLKLEVTWSM